MKKQAQKTQETSNGKGKKAHPRKFAIYLAWLTNKDADGITPKILHQAMYKAGGEQVALGTIQAHAAHFRKGERIPAEYAGMVAQAQASNPKAKTVKPLLDSAQASSREAKNAKQRARRAAAKAKAAKQEV